MLRMSVLSVLLWLSAVPAWAGEGGSFDPDQFSRQAWSPRLLESLLNQAMATLDDHFDLSGDVEGNGNQQDRRRGFQFKFYPEGKSKSDHHLSAEGWFGPSTDARRQEFHLQFAFPQSSPEHASPLPDNVL